jgi:hypothetical protein
MLYSLRETLLFSSYFLHFLYSGMGYSGAHVNVVDQLKCQVVRSPEKVMVDSQL